MLVKWNWFSVYTFLLYNSLCRNIYKTKVLYLDQSYSCTMPWEFLGFVHNYFFMALEVCVWTLQWVKVRLIWEFEENFASKAFNTGHNEIISPRWLFDKVEQFVFDACYDHSFVLKPVKNHLVFMLSGMSREVFALAITQILFVDIFLQKVGSKKG